VRDVPSYEAAIRVPYQRGAIDGESVEKRDDVRSHVGNPVAGLGTLRVAEAALIEGKSTKTLRQQRKNPTE